LGEKEFLRTMIVSRTPLRISFVGGGSDIRAFYKHGFGSVVSSAINKYVYVVINKKFDNTIKLHYSQTELVDNVDQVKHDIIRETLKLFGIRTGIEIAYLSDLPMSKTGSGLGSSSSFAVGLLNALHRYTGKIATPDQLAEEACKIELEILKRPGGKQDQYAAAYGGFNHFRFHPDEKVEIEPVLFSQKQKETLNKKFLLFYTGLDTESSAVLSVQVNNTSANMPILQTMVGLSEKLPPILLQNNFTAMGEMLHENWMHKQKLADRITNPTINLYYEKALQAGAKGGKILGSGGGGFLLFYCDEAAQNNVRNALQNLRELAFEFEDKGSTIVFKD
jgi:D-glycero-alpha-D-manno-heptose-7-phosphate kinase